STACPRSFASTTSAPTVLSSLSLHDALPIFRGPLVAQVVALPNRDECLSGHAAQHRAPGPADGPRTRARADRRKPQHPPRDDLRSEEHTSELQSPYDLVCRLLLEKKNKTK